MTSACPREIALEASASTTPSASTTATAVPTEVSMPRITYPGYPPPGTRQLRAVCRLTCRRGRVLSAWHLIHPAFGADVPARAVAGAHCPRPDEPAGPAVSAP